MRAGENSIQTDQLFFLGVEIGATKHQIAIGDDQGNLLCVRRGKVVLKDGAAGILAWLKQNIPELLAWGIERGGTIAAIGVGFGGIIESATGRILTSVQVEGWKDFLLKTWFEENFRLPTVILNDTVAGGYGEYGAGAGRGTTNFFYTNIGSGIGGAFIVDGRYYDGLGYGAAYFGHTYVPDWTAESPGAARKVEDLCSGWAIERRLRTPGYIPANSLLLKRCDGDYTGITCQMMGDAAAAGDPFAQDEIERIAGSFGTGLANVITLFSPRRVVIGGGVSNMGDILLEPIRSVVAEKVFLSAKGRYRIEKSRFGDEVVLVGAVLYVARHCRKLETNKER